MEHKYQPGDEVIVTGDSAFWHHEFLPGARGVIVRLFDHDNVPGYSVCVKETNEYANEQWNVAEMDIQLAWAPVTDEELAEVLASLRESLGN